MTGARKVAKNLQGFRGCVRSFPVNRARPDDSWIRRWKPIHRTEVCHDARHGTGYDVGYGVAGL